MVAHAAETSTLTFVEDTKEPMVGATFEIYAMNYNSGEGIRFSDELKAYAEKKSGKTFSDDTASDESPYLSSLEIASYGLEYALDNYKELVATVTTDDNGRVLFPSYLLKLGSDDYYVSKLFAIKQTTYDQNGYKFSQYQFVMAEKHRDPNTDRITSYLYKCQPNPDGWCGHYTEGACEPTWICMRNPIYITNLRADGTPAQASMWGYTEQDKNFREWELDYDGMFIIDEGIYDGQEVALMQWGGKCDCWEYKADNGSFLRQIHFVYRDGLITDVWLSTDIHDTDATQGTTLTIEGSGNEIFLTNADEDDEDSNASIKIDNYSVSLSLVGTKQLMKASSFEQFRELADSEFTFLLKDAEGKTVAKAHNTADGVIKFADIFFDTPGTYPYTITEEEGGDHTITYSKQIKTISVTVTEENAKLRIEAKLTSG